MYDRKYQILTPPNPTSFHPIFTKDWFYLFAHIYDFSLFEWWLYSVFVCTCIKRKEISIFPFLRCCTFYAFWLLCLFVIYFLPFSEEPQLSLRLPRQKELLQSSWLKHDNSSFEDLYEAKKSRNGDTLGPVELIVCPKQGNQGNWREQDDEGEVSITIFGMSKSSGF